MSTTDNLLETLIQSNQSLNENVSNLTESVNNLVTIDAARAEREKNQEEKNEKYDNFIKDNTETLMRVKRGHGHWDKVADKVYALLAIAVLGLLGFNFVG